MTMFILYTAVFIAFLNIVSLIVSAVNLRLIKNAEKFLREYIRCRSEQNRRAYRAAEIAGEMLDSIARMSMVSMKTLNNKRSPKDIDYALDSYAKALRDKQELMENERN